MMNLDFLATIRRRQSAMNAVEDTSPVLKTAMKMLQE
jgi:hypothetical protein